MSGRAQEPDELRLRVEQLYRRFCARGLEQGEFRSECQSELRALRLAFRGNSERFTPDLLDMLKAISKGLHDHGRPSILQAEQTLAAVFGYPAFRPGQREIIRAVLAGQDCVGIMPTGAGKSLTYQIPARVLKGVTLVISPLIALMKDQVDSVSEFGMRATFLNSSLTPDERAERMHALRQGEYELLYAAPEGIEASVGRMLSELDLSLIAVDEAHCISHWGHDFRPAYRNLKNLKRRFRSTPILALTATATHEVTEDIVTQLGMLKPALFKGSFFRDNLKLHVYQKGDALGISTREAISRLVRARAGSSGIIYCLSRKAAEGLAEYLKGRGIKAGCYHAGLTPEERTRVQEAFRDDALDVVVATIAFGMGIDKSNVRYVIHRDMPRSIEGYYQEIGRAGRDGLPSDCVLFYSWSEVKAYDRFADESPDTDAGARLSRQAREMFQYAEQAGCRHQQLLLHFGEQAPKCESACDFCTQDDLLARTPSHSKRATAARGKHAEEGPPNPSAAGLIKLADLELFEALKSLRLQLAQERKVPAYVVFSDATLIEIATRRPSSLEEMLGITGIGPTKLERYGAAFLKLVTESTASEAPT